MVALGAADLAEDVRTGTYEICMKNTCRSMKRSTSHPPCKHHPPSNALTATTREATVHPQLPQLPPSTISSSTRLLMQTVDEYQSLRHLGWARHWGK